MQGFPNVLHPGLFVDAGLTDGWYRQVAADTSLDLSSALARWGSEKASQWYLVYALAGDEDSAFTLKAMPLMRFKSQASQIISLGTNNAPGTGIGYGFVTDELAGFMLYVLSGVSAGMLRPITANNNDNGTAGTITYSGAALTLSQGDWFAVLPAANFRWLGNVRNGTGSNLWEFYQDGNRYRWGDDHAVTGSVGGATVENVDAVDPMATWCTLDYYYYGSAAIIVEDYVAHPEETSLKYRWPLFYNFNDPNYTLAGVIQSPVKNCRTYFHTQGTMNCRDYTLPAGFFG